MLLGATGIKAVSKYVGETEPRMELRMLKWAFACKISM